MDSEDELYGRSRPEEITIHDDDSEIDHEEHHSERDSSPEQPFDFGADSDHHDEEEDAYLLEGDSLPADLVEAALSAQQDAAEPASKRRRLSQENSIEVLELSDSEEGEIDEPMPSVGEAVGSREVAEQRQEGSTSSSALTTAPRGLGGLSRVFSFGTQARDSPLAPLLSNETASAQSTGGLFGRVFSAGSSTLADSAQLESSLAVEAPASLHADSTTTATRLPHGSAASPAAAASPQLSLASPAAAEATSDNPAFSSRGAVQYDVVDMSLPDVPSNLTAAGSSTATAPISIQPITIPRARERATYQRRVDLSSTPVGTPVVVEAKVRDDRGKVTYRPSPLQPACVSLASSLLSLVLSSPSLSIQTNSPAYSPPRSYLDRYG
ncbi:hypothetical protein BCR35DRAFT_77056 [Leucosporidium creatinivorum]|uniref:Uncharacterized protein n=1 Tax=Leucosporidium creatinivorum TaxID=106004 RepID=A0A1Y2G335_9BASI|nr:hypothetical protein BCR35DRAFT_77056 [Leucosporidium creatinivorum]